MERQIAISSTYEQQQVFDCDGIVAVIGTVAWALGPAMAGVLFLYWLLS